MLNVENWGRIPYLEAWARQKVLLQKRIAGEVGDTLVFCEHDPIITLGRASLRAAAPEVFVDDIPVLEVERGGNATYHGPGQIVVYPIFQLGRSIQSTDQSCAAGSTPTAYATRGVHNLIRALEQWVITYLKEFAVPARTVAGKTGVWVSEDRKIASIGIAARHWVSYHGIALNLNTGKAPWQKLSPCGFSSNVMTDLQLESGIVVSTLQAIDGLLKHVNILTSSADLSASAL